MRNLKMNKAVAVCSATALILLIIFFAVCVSGCAAPALPATTTTAVAPTTTKAPPAIASNVVHIHSYESEDVPPSCEAEGYTQYTCSCGDFYIDSVEAPVGHTWGDWVTTKEPTTAEEGEQGRTCQACDAFETQQLEKLPAPTHLHGYAGQIVSPTCTEDGYIRYTCSCGDSYTEFLSPAMGHSYVSSKVEPTCLTAGYTVHICSCGDRYEDAHVAALEHDFADYASNGDATCTQDGTKTAKCSRCDETFTIADPGSATGHTWSAWATELAAGCLTTGTETHTCSICSARESRETEALGHRYQPEITAPTCTAEGFTTHICADCGHQMMDTETAALGHSFTSYVSNGDATCTRDGTKTATCDRCSATDMIVDSGSMMEHVYEKTTIAPTCIKQGYTIYRCSCTAEYVSDYVPQIDHTWEDWETVKAATCIGVGEEKRACAYCTASEKQSIAPIGHKYKEEIIVATCNSGGYTLHICTACDHQVKDALTSPLGHEFKNYKSNGDAACTKDGTKTAKCTRCSVTDTVVDKASAKAHSYGDWIITAEATCTAAGTEMHTCTVCGDEQTRQISQAPHDYQLISTQESTTTVAGFKLFNCLNCTASYQETLPLKPPAIETDMCGESLLGKVLPNAPYPEFAQAVFQRIGLKLDKTGAIAAGRIPFPVYGDKETILNAFHFPYIYIAQSVSYTVYLDKDNATANFLFWGDPEDYQMVEAIYQRAYEVLAELKIDRSVTKKEAITRINEWICEQKYYENNMSLLDNSTYHSMFGKGAVCHNYAIAFQLLCLGAGIECHYYGSDTMNHAWNKVYFSDGSYYWVDTCWNDVQYMFANGTVVETSVANGVPAASVKRLREQYLLITTEKLLKDHTL